MPQVQHTKLKQTAIILGIALVVAFASVSSQSFWIDESGSAILAIDRDPLAFTQDRGSTLQMPGYMLSLWAWEKIFGSSEYALRAMNIPFFLAAILTTLLAFRAATTTRLFFALLLCLSPMVWIYMDEARPYILQFTGSTLILIGMFNQGKNSDSLPGNLLLFCIGSLVLCASSLTGVVFTLFFGLGFLAILLAQKKFRSLLGSPANLAILAISLVLLLPLALFYLWTLQTGAAASSVGKTSPATLAFAAYELLGFTGFGPGRLELRAQGMAALVPFLPIILFLCLVTILVAASPLCARLANPPSASTWIIACSVLLGASTMAALGILKDFRIVGRHMTPLLPFLLLFLSFCLTELWQSKLKINKSIALIYLLLLAASSISARVDTRFQKDDYRSAAKLAQSYLGQGKTVWWAADEASLLYYLSEAERHIASKSVFLAFGPRATPIEFRKQPDLVLLSKPDIYDPNRLLANFLNENAFTLLENYKAFEAYNQVK